MNNTEVAHKWAQNNNDSGKGSNIFYENGIIYSYGYHFEMARHFKGLVLMNSNSYSASTSKHQGYVRQAVNHLEVISVPTLIGDKDNTQHRNAKHKENINYFLSGITSSISSLATARKPEIYVDSIRRTVNSMRRYCDLLSVPQSCLNKKATDLLNDGYEVDEIMLQAIRDKNKSDNIKAERRARKLAKDWINHEGSLHSSDPVFLRLSELSDKVETSQGVSVPIKEARLLFAVVKRSAINGTSLNSEQLNGCGKIGYYNIDRIVKGDITAGCHHIKYKEIADFAKRVNW